MAGEIPDGVAIEQIFVIEARYGPHAPELRPRYRHEHLTRIARLREDGVIIEAGGLSDFSKAILFVRAADAGAARALALDDIYLHSGVWVDVDVHGFGRVCRPEEVRPTGTGA